MTARYVPNARLLLAGGAGALIACSAWAGPPKITIVFTEIAGHPTSAAPGMLDLSGNPVAAKFDALQDIAISHDGTKWVLRADTDLPTTHDQVLLLGSGVTATPIAQDGQPVPGTTTGETWDFFDPDYPASFDEAGNVAFSGRAKPATSIKEKVFKIINGQYILVVTESTPATGLIDVPANPTGDELIGNSIGSVSLRNDGKVFFGNTPIQNCHSNRYPALFLDNAAFLQSGVSQIGFETWDDIGYADCGMAPDGNNWYAIGDTENPDTTIDKIFAVNNIKIAQENTALGATGIVVGSGSPFFFCRMIANGDWFLRGDDTVDNDWAIRGNGSNWTLIAKTGDPITTGATENWGAVFTAFHGNTKGDWVLAGNTNNPNTSLDNVVVLNGEQVILRENDPVDLNGNGQNDDDLFISSFWANDLLITDSRELHVLVALRNGAGTAMGDAYLQVQLAPPPPPPCIGDIAPGGTPDGVVNVQDMLAVINAWGACNDCPPSCLGDLNNDCVVNVGDLLTVINAWGPCPQ